MGEMGIISLHKCRYC